MQTEQNIPLNQLVHSKANVRHTGRMEGIGELAASIAAHGLRQNLNVMANTEGKFEVVAGARRLRAMKQLAKAGKLAKDAPIACLVLDEADDAAEISLAENAMRTAMHPDDQYEAFRVQIEDKGASVEEVAARFGVTPAVVRQRLKLANVSPKLRGLFRKGVMGLEHVMALAISDDHAAQEQAWENLPKWDRDPANLKDALTHEHVPMTDRLAKFIGAEAYVTAGGVIVRDLFDEEDEGYLADRALVMRLVTEKLEQAAEEVKAEGWKWIKTELTRDYRINYRHVGQDARSDSDDEPDSEKGAFSAEDKARAGALLQITHDGTLRIERGCIHPDEAKVEAKRAGAPKGENPSGLSAALVTDLTAHRTAALRVELTRSPTVALAMTVHALALGLLYQASAASCLDIRATSAGLDRHTQALGDSPAHQALAEEGARWGDLLPGDEAQLLTWCLDQPQSLLLDLLAFLAGLTVDAVQIKQCRMERHDHADQLADTLSLDMAAWWTPSVEGFYQRLPKAALVKAVIEAKGSSHGVSFDSLKKVEAARFAASAINGSGWLPEPLRMRVDE